MKHVGEMHARTIALSISLLVLILPLVSTLQTDTVNGGGSGGGGIRPNPVLNIAINNLQQFTFDQSYYFQPALVQGMDGTVWVFYEYIFFNQHSALPVIAYRTTQSPGTVYNATNWSAQSTLSATPKSQNVNPSTSTYKNGTLYVAFASNRTGNFNIFVKKYNTGVGWGPDYQVTVNTLDQIGNSVLAANDGSLWVFYDRQLNSNTASIYYRILHNGQTPVEVQFTNTTTGVQDQQPSAYQLNDGSIVVTWTHTDSSGNSNIYSRKYANGVWGAVAQITTSNTDSNPKVIQDQNTTLWVAFTHEIPQGGSNFQVAVYYMYSINLGTSWAPSTNLTNDACGTPCPTSENAALAQLKDGRVYLFFTSNRDPASYWNLYYASTNIMPYHNVAITGFTYGPTYHIRLGALVTINVTVADTGTFPESFFLFVTATNTSYTPPTTNIAVQYLSLGAGQSMKIQIAWNGSPAIPGEYVLGAHIPPVNNDIVTGDNTISSGTLRLYPQGDVNWDGAVNILDLATIAAHYNTSIGQPGYLPDADLDGNGIINIVDLATCAFYFGTVG